MIYLGADHAGFELKEKIKQYLVKQKIDFKDLGAFKLVKDDDYPQYGYKVAKAVVKDKNYKGILICGTSHGVCIVANKVKGVRAGSVKTVKEAKELRHHNDGNVICLSGWETSLALAKCIVDAFLITKFEALPRRKRRNNQLKKIENKEFK